MLEKSLFNCVMKI